MSVRSIRSMGICALLLWFLSGGAAAGERFVYSGLVRPAPPAVQNPDTAPLRVSRRPKLAPIPNLNIYYTPDLRYNLYLADKRWYLLHNEKWYQSQTHEGPWRYLSYSKVPESLKKIPGEFIKKENAPLPLKKKPPSPKRKKSSGKKAGSKSIKKS
ncbi:MAG: hypothetical protein EPO39_03145 [Candidatus Manganitrophaceae bacterium]|nr:MAG: hypothetical protein EPO39_03145 [Candidatus Manganitrophaceae bacterium]